jgi:hypothetical protein
MAISTITRIARTNAPVIRDITAYALKTTGCDTLPQT